MDTIKVRNEKDTTAEHSATANYGNIFNNWLCSGLHTMAVT